MINKTSVLLSVFLASSALFLTPTTALAVPIQNLNGQTGQTQTFANDTNVTISSASNVHSLGWNGVLSVLRGGTGAGSFSNGSVLFSNGTTFAQDNSNLFWDNTNKRLGIGTSSPSAQLHIAGPGQNVNDNYGLLIDDKTAGTNNYNIWSGSPLDAIDPRLQYRFIGGAENVFATVGNEEVRTAGSFVSQGSSGIINPLDAEAFVTGNGSAIAAWFTPFSIAPLGQSSNLQAIYIRDENDGEGQVDNMVGVGIDQFTSVEGAGQVGSTYGIQVAGQALGLNNYSIFTGQASGPNNYALYNAGDAKSYFGGKVGIKTQNPDASLDVVGSIKGDSTIILGNSTTPACIEAADSDGSGVSYITVNDGVISASATKPSFCQ